MNKKGLTLIELLAVIAIIAILFVLLIPQISSGIYKAKVSGLQTDFRDYQIPLEGYIMENGFPKEISFINEVFKGELRFEKGESVAKSPFDTKYNIVYNKEKIEIYTTDDTEDKKTYSLIFKNNEEGAKTEFLGFEEVIKFEEKPPYTVKEEDLELINNGDGTYSVKRYNVSERNIIIKSNIDGKVIKNINASSFDKTAIDKVVIEEGIETIKEGAFAETNLKEIHIPSTIKTIGYNAFVSNPKTKFYVSNSNTLFKNGDNGSGLYSKDGKTLLAGGMDIFDTEAIKTVEIFNPTSLYDKNLGEIKIPASLKTIGNTVMSSNPNIRFVVDPANTVFKAGTNGIGLYSKDGKTLYVGIKEVFNQPEYNTVEYIANTAFYGAKLEELKLPTSIKRIGVMAFRGNNFKEITLPATITTIDASSFGYNYQLTKVINKTALDLSGHFPSTVLITR